MSYHIKLLVICVKPVHLHLEIRLIQLLVPKLLKVKRIICTPWILVGSLNISFFHFHVILTRPIIIHLRNFILTSFFGNFSSIFVFSHYLFCCGKFYFKNFCCFFKRIFFIQNEIYQLNSFLNKIEITSYDIFEYVML